MSTASQRNSHRALMLIACAFVLLVAGLLVALGLAGGAAVVGALACVAAMGVMMFAMHRIEHH